MRSGASTLVVPDTCVLIDLFRSNAVAEEIDRRGWIFWISAVVHSELLRGVEGREERRFIASLVRGRPPVAPSRAQWASCGVILGRLRSDEGFDAAGLRRIQSDVLIALTARGLGLPVVTTNPGDFARIARHLRGLRVIDL
ncbi:MAG: type II toxin-antitoxin system VapC family toxin [Myxococcales bacterium]|nr:type II toxin-antitoxin system VapC family toxin [Myxococcales bacterium]